MTDITPSRPRSTRKTVKNRRFGKVTTPTEEEEEEEIDKNQQPPKPTKLYPGLNDITDAFEAFPTDLVKYFTLLKEIDAKCVQPLPELEHQIKRFQTIQSSPSNINQRNEMINTISNLLNEVLPCLEEKMHVASIGADKAISFIDRINDDYDLIINQEIPDSIIYGEPHHPAIMDIKVADTKSAQSQRSESRREALAARKAVATETDNEDSGNMTTTNTTHVSTTGNATTTTGKSGKARKGGPDKEGTPTPGQANSNGGGSGGSGNNTGNVTKKRKPNNNTNKENTSQTKNEDGTTIQRPTTPSSANKRRTTQNKKKTSASDGSNISQSQTTTDQKKSTVVTPEPEEPTYCYCGQVSYGEMVGCDGEDCQREWFHLPCTGLNNLPRGKWYCDDCKALNELTQDKKKTNKK